MVDGEGLEGKLVGVCEWHNSGDMLEWEAAGGGIWDWDSKVKEVENLYK